MELNWKEQAMDLWSKGMNDMQISKELNIHYQTIWKWRQENKLKKNDIYRQVTMTDEQKSILIGGLIGDGSIFYKTKLSRYPSYQLCHTYQQKEYFMYKYEKMKGIMNHYNIIHDYVYKAHSMNLGIMKDLHEIFYKDGKKIMPSYEYMYEFYNELAFAITFYDDGNCDRCRNRITFRLYLCNFTRDEQLLYCKILKDKFNIDSVLHKHKTKYTLVYINSRSNHIVQEILSKYPIESVKYKIGPR
jgi:hypothetical protein